MTSVVTNAQIHIVGLEIRTSNAEAFQTIPPHWQRFYGEQTLNRIPHAISSDVYAVYTNFEHPGQSNEGVYSFIIGAAVEPGTKAPEGLTAVTIPAEKRAVFEVETGKPELVGAKWQEIWGQQDLKKSFVSDYEKYEASGKIGIYIGLK